MHYLESLQPGVPNQTCFYVAGLSPNEVNRGAPAIKTSDVTLHTGERADQWWAGDTACLIYVCPKFSGDLRRAIFLHTLSKIQEVISDRFASSYLLSRIRSPASHSILWIAFPPRTSAGNTSIRPVRYRRGDWFINAPCYGKTLMCPLGAKGEAILSVLQKCGLPSIALQTAPSWGNIRWCPCFPARNRLTPSVCCLWRAAPSRAYGNLLKWIHPVLQAALGDILIFTKVLPCWCSLCQCRD